MPKKWVPEKRRIAGGRPDLTSGGVVKSAGRVLQILEFFDDVRREASVIEICTTLGYPQSSTSALLHSLVVMGFLSYNPNTRAYAPTIRVALLGHWVNDRLFRNGQLLRLMEAINRKTGHSVLLATRSGLYAKYIHVIQATNPARLHITLGTERSLAGCGSGFVILSHYPDAEVQKIVRAINAYAPSPEKLVSIPNLMKILARVRQRGYSLEPDAVTKGSGVIAMSLPAVGAQTEPLVIGVGGISQVLVESEHEIVAVLRDAIETYLKQDDLEPALEDKR